MATPTEYVLKLAEDYAPRFISWFLYQFRKPRMTGIAGAMLAEVQELDAALYELYTGLNINTAEGVQLDMLGRLLQVRRDGYDDDVYRTRLRVEILILRSAGTPDDLINICIAALTPGVEFSYSESYPAGVTVEILDPTPEFMPTEILRFLNRARALGVRIGLVWSPETSAHTFTYAAGNDEELDTDRGYGDDADPDVGGVYASAYE